MYFEEDLSRAILAYRNNEYTSIRKLADAFLIPRSTLRHRLSGRVSYATAHEQEQYLSTAEEKTLVRWISKLSNLGCPIPPSLARNLAFEIRSNRYTLLTPLPLPTPPPTPPGKRWLDRLRKRYPEIESVYSRQIEVSRYKGVSYPIVDAYFTALTDLFT